MPVRWTATIRLRDNRLEADGRLQLKMTLIHAFRLFCVPIIVIGIGLFVQCPFSQAVDLHLGNIKANRILFLGNSVTLHAPRAEVGWSGNWGMAAIVQANDYVHRLTTKINSTIGGTLELGRSTDDGVKNIVNIASVMELNFATYDNSSLQTQIDYQPDLVVLQFGENVQAASFDEDSEKAALKSSLQTLLDGLKASSNPHIFVTSGIIPGTNPTIDAIKREVCAEDISHRVFVDLSGFGNDLTNLASGEYVLGNEYNGLFTNSAVLNHPGNKGMQYVAEGIYSAMEAHAAMTPEPGTMAMISIAGSCFGGFAWRRRRVGELATRAANVLQVR